MRRAVRRRNAQCGQASSAAQVFGELLTHQREAAGLRQADLARQLHCDRTLVTRVESGNRVPDEPFVTTCDQILSTGGALLRLWRRIDWYPQVEHPDWFQRRADMDAEAVALREYQAQVIPGLLQTEGYARALFSQVDSGEALEGRVAARLSRQQRFMNPQGPLLIAVLDESSLRTAVGAPHVMGEQCAHLLAMGERPNIVVQVAMFDSGTPIVRPSTPVTLITMPDGHEWVYSESLDRGHFNDAPVAVAKHSRSYDVLRADALSAPDSAALISRIMEGYRQHEHHRSRRGDVAQEQLQRKQRRQLHRGSPRFPRRRPRA
ncbi:Scr1 family TA system antitoxin-like transcriptional regulator [Streptomyces sp. NPDC017056]|uniref:helix-turn-helix domain-containing protein n=1 Tax=Streptomyces sp. NPDC017056 TaxID=3364973 RepID=UPI003799641B